MPTIKIGKDYSKAPPVLCPHCKKELHLMLDEWRDDQVKIVKANCPYCNGEIFSSIQILMAGNLRDLNTLLQSIQEALPEKNLNLIDNPNMPKGSKIIQ